MSTIPNQVEHVENEHVTLNNNQLAFAESIGASGASNKSLSEVLSPKEHLKATVSFKALVESDKQRLTRTGAYWKCSCPFHPDRTPSFIIDENDDRARCYGCGWYGDIFKYVMDRTGCSFGASFHHLAQAPSLHDTKTKRVPKASRPQLREYQFTAKEVTEIERGAARICKEDWLCERIASSRNWKPETIRKLAQQRHLAWGGDALDFVYKTGIKVRQWPGKEFYWWAGERHVWRGDLLAGRSTVYLTEGEPDAITLIDAGLDKQKEVAVVAAPSASTFHNAWADLFEGKDVTICFDADEAGRKGAERVGELLSPVAKSVFNIDLKEVA
jgi:hypothetical protein